MRHRIGVSQLVWGSDFAHIVTDWPHSCDLIERTFVGVSAQERERMLVSNVIDYFHLASPTSGRSSGEVAGARRL